jgi:hypothetical protein
VDAPASGRRIGYARTSTTGQDTALQCDALRRDGCERIVVEAVSGAGADRPVLEECLADLAAGDSLVVWRLDRLGRSAQHGVSLRKLPGAANAVVSAGHNSDHLWRGAPSGVQQHCVGGA